MGVKSYAILGYSGGKAKALADVPIHFAVDDMQISEDLQLIVGHMLMQWLYANRPRRGAERWCGEKFLVIGSQLVLGRELRRLSARAGRTRWSASAARRSRTVRSCRTAGMARTARSASIASTSTTISTALMALVQR